MDRKVRFLKRWVLPYQNDRKRKAGIRVVEPHIQDDLKEAVNRHVMRALRGEI